MKLKIEISKEFEKPSVLTCSREDGTITYAKLHPNLEIHDIAHFVVETNLKFSNAFYGLLAQGYSISDFQLPKDKRPKELQPKNLAPEALITEHIVNILQTKYAQGKQETDYLSITATILKERKLSFPASFTAKKFEEMYYQLEDLMIQWEALSFNQKLVLNFEV